MREYQVTLDETFVNGLRKEAERRINAKFLTQCKYFKPRSMGLVPTGDVSNPFSSNRYDSWPFPQLIMGNDITLLAGSDTLQEVDTSDWSLSDVPVYDANDEEESTSITAGGQWHFADFFSTWMLFNGNCVLFKTNRYGMFGDENEVYCKSDVTIQTGCAFKGRMVMGGFNPSDYWSTDWKAILEQWTQNFDYDISLDLTMGTNFIWWSTIGGGDVLNLFYPNLATTGMLKEAEEEDMFMYYLKRNEAGLMPMPWNGTVRKVLPLGQKIVVYGDRGIAMIYPVSAPVATMGMQKLSSIGVPDRGAVGGDDNQHVFIDNSGTLWSNDVENGLNRLGYKEIFSNYLGQDISISFNTDRYEFYICGQNEGGDNLSYVLSKYGLGQSNQLITSGAFTGGAFSGIFCEEASTEGLVVTEAFDFGNREKKTVTGIEFGGQFDSDTDVHVALDWRNSVSDSYAQTSWHGIGSKGWAHFHCTGIEFRLCVKTSNYEQTKVNYINIKWQQVGKRNIRGISAPATYI